MRKLPYMAMVISSLFVRKKMPRIMRRTPETEEAAGYGYREFLGDAIRRVGEGASRNVERFLAGEVGGEEMLEMALSGLGGSTKIARGVGKAAGGMWKMPISRPHLAKAEEIPLEARAIVEKFKQQGLTYDAYVNQIPDMPEMAYHQWTFRGEGPLKGATVTTKGTGMQEFGEMITDRIRKFKKDPRR